MLGDLSKEPLDELSFADEARKVVILSLPERVLLAEELKLALAAEWKALCHSRWFRNAGQRIGRVFSFLLDCG